MAIGKAELLLRIGDLIARLKGTSTPSKDTLQEVDEYEADLDRIERDLAGQKDSLQDNRYRIYNAHMQASQQEQTPGGLLGRWGQGQGTERTDCPLCQSRQSVDTEGFCYACSKTVTPKTTLPWTFRGG